MSDMDNLLDATLDDIADLPEFKPFPAGAHRCLLTLESKEIAGHPAVEATFTLQETIEQSNPEDAPSKPQDTANSAFFLDNEFGQGNLKKLVAPIAEALGYSTLREIVEGTKGVEVLIISAVQIDKNDDTKKYLKVKELQVV